MIQKYYKYVDGIENEFDPIVQLMTSSTDQVVKDKLLTEYYQLVKTFAFHRFINAMVEKIEMNSAFSPFWTSNTEAPIAATRHAVLSLRYHDSECSQQSLYGVPNDIYFTLLHSNEPVDIIVYAIDQNNYSLSHKVTYRLEKNQSIHLQKGETFKIETKGIACFSRLLIGLGECTHVFDANSLQYLSMLSLNPTSSRWYFMARVASMLDEKAALEILEKLTKHEHYNVRWVALQELFNVNQDTAITTLDNFRNDENVFIAQKAKSEWERISLLLAS